MFGKKRFFSTPELTNTGYYVSELELAISNKSEIKDKLQQPEVLEYLSQFSGHTYQEISDKLLEKYNIKVSRIGLQRIFKKYGLGEIRKEGGRGLYWTQEELDYLLSLKELTLQEAFDKFNVKFKPRTKCALRHKIIALTGKSFKVPELSKRGQELQFRKNLFQNLNRPRRI